MFHSLSLHIVPTFEFVSARMLNLQNMPGCISQHSNATSLLFFFLLIILICFLAAPLFLKTRLFVWCTSRRQSGISQVPDAVRGGSTSVFNHFISAWSDGRLVCPLLFR